MLNVLAVVILLVTNVFAWVIVAIANNNMCVAQQEARDLAQERQELRDALSSDRASIRSLQSALTEEQRQHRHLLRRRGRNAIDKAPGQNGGVS